MYEKLIEALRMGADYGVEEESVGKLCADAAAAIEALQAENETLHQHIEDLNRAFRSESLARQKAEAAQPHWVSVKHPPTEGRRYWVWHVDGFCYCDTWRCGKWELADAIPDTKITHWMPLPEPPQEVQDGTE